MTQPKRVLMTGNNGYIGSVMGPALLEAGYDVVGVDTGYFNECTLVPDTAEIRSVTKDIRDVQLADLDGYDAVIHLAALSNDPIGNLEPRWTEEINFQASVRLAQLAKATGVRRFLFSSSCIMYGMSSAAVVTEDSPLDPKTEYARSKVRGERAIALLADEHFSPTFLRNGTVYGASPRMRFDTVLNNLMGSAITTGKVVLQSDGTPWRPVIHVQDIARAFLAVLEAPLPDVHNQAFNVGGNHLNHQIIELAEIVSKTVPRCTLEVLATTDADQRTYKADFGKFARVFPDFNFQWTAQKGAEELYEALLRVRVPRDAFLDRRFTRLTWLRHLLTSHRLDGSLRWSVASVEGRHD